MKSLTQSLLFLAAVGLLGGNTHAGGAKLAHVDDLKDKRIGVLQGSAHVDYVTKTSCSTSTRNTWERCGAPVPPFRT